MAKIDLICRYLKARQGINENAGVLADYIENQKNIDAVVLDMDKLEASKRILNGFSDMTFCLVNVNNHLILMFPEEERQKYMDIQLELMSGDVIDEYKKFTYSEATAAKDFLQAANVTYQSTIDGDGRIKFLVPRQYAYIMEQAMNTIREEVQTKVGKDYYNAQNVCYMNAINQLSQAINYDGVSFIGKEGGTDGVRIDDKGAVYINTKGTGRFISRNSSRFEHELLKLILNDLNGINSPVKAFYGEFAEEITKGMTKESIKTPALTKNKSLDILRLDSMPDIEHIGKMINDIDNYDEEKRGALRAIIRMRLCRDQKLKDLQEYKQSKQDKTEYLNIHSENVDKFKSFDMQNRREPNER